MRLATGFSPHMPGVSPCGICDGQSDTGAGFSLSPLVSPVNITTPILHIHPCIIWGEGQ
jgi:hypothetical protein